MNPRKPKNLKAIIRNKQILESAINQEFTIPGEPLIYSVKPMHDYTNAPLEFYRNKQYYSILRTVFRSFRKTMPVVVIVRFYVTPHIYDNNTEEDIKKECAPAYKNYELMDYLLSFMEMLFLVLIADYRQIVKVDAEKICSKNPRTTMKIMHWKEYEQLKNKGTLHTSAKKGVSDRKVPKLQSKRADDAKDAPVRKRKLPSGSD